MRKITTVSTMITFIICFFFLDTNAQTTGNRADLVNKTWRFVAMKCPDAMGTTGNDDNIKYFMSLRLNQDNYVDMNHGRYVKIYRDMRDNPREEGTYTIISDMETGTKLVLKPKHGDAVEYRVETVLPNHLTLIQLSDIDKCKISYAIAL